MVFPKVQGLHDFSYCLLQHTEIYCLKKPEAMIILVHVSHSIMLYCMHVAIATVTVQLNKFYSHAVIQAVVWQTCM